MKTEKIISRKELLLENLERLPESDVKKILEFAEFLQIKRYKRKIILKKEILDPEKDPVAKLIGIADVKPFANTIDQELYGK